MKSSIFRKDLENELNKVISDEKSIDSELRDYFSSLSSKNGTKGTRAVFDNDELLQSSKKIESFLPYFEVIGQSSTRLCSQIDECRALSDRLNVLVRRLNTMQVKAQEALACTNNILDLKNSRQLINSFLQENNLVAAINALKKIHEIDKFLVENSEDATDISVLESTLRDRLWSEFNTAVENANLDQVMKLCPLLQTCSLEVDARDLFLEFMEKNVFIAINAEAVVAEDASDPAMAYVQSLSNLFNACYLILQKYLPLVIQGMSNSNGDIFFIR